MDTLFGSTIAPIPPAQLPTILGGFGFGPQGTWARVGVFLQPRAVVTRKNALIIPTCSTVDADRQARSLGVRQMQTRWQIAPRRLDPTHA